MYSDEVKAEVAHWIDTTALAEAILDDLAEEGLPPTVENAQKLWLDFLGTELHEGIGSVLRHSPAFRN